MTPRPGQSLGGRPVTETVTPVNMGNRPYCDNGEGVATASPLPSRLKRLGGSGRYRAAVRLTDYKSFSSFSQQQTAGLLSFVRLRTDKPTFCAKLTGQAGMPVLQ